jgi:hypothetical protein
MPPPNDREYLERRLRLSQEKARTTADPSVARIHENFAQAYARRLNQQLTPHAE